MFGAPDVACATVTETPRDVSGPGPGPGPGPFPRPSLEGLAAHRFGLTRFRPGQRELLEAVLAGQDALGVLPTGGGKSLVYQLAALFFEQPVVVVSPLLALMKDQVEHLARAHVRAVQLDSTLSAEDERSARARIRRGEHDLVYVTPERLATRACLAELREAGVSLLAIDEAHCVTSWGHDFRPAYLRIAEAAAALGRPPIVALTATATPETCRDIERELGLRAPRVVRTSMMRPNLHFEVSRTVNDAAKRSALLRVLAQVRGVVLVYTATVKTADALFAWLGALREPVARYHAKMTPTEREASRARFMSGAVRVMVATKAFGMGIDKPDIRAVVHYEAPDSLESYVQEAGRAGRDGEEARAVLLYRHEDRRVQQFFAAKKYASAKEVQKVCE